jgi:hypothetical protein
MPTQIFKVLNPSTGEYTTCLTREDCIQQLARNAYAFYLLHTHGVPYAVVTTNDDNSQTWESPKGEKLMLPFNMDRLYSIIEEQAKEL